MERALVMAVCFFSHWFLGQRPPQMMILADSSACPDFVQHIPDLPLTWQLGSTKGTPPHLVHLSRKLAKLVVPIFLIGAVGLGLMKYHVLDYLVQVALVVGSAYLLATRDPRVSRTVLLRLTVALVVLQTLHQFVLPYPTVQLQLAVS